MDLKEIIRDSFGFLIKLNYPQKDIATLLKDNLTNKFNLTNDFSNLLTSRVLYKFTYGNPNINLYNFEKLIYNKKSEECSSLDEIINSAFNIVVQGWKVNSGVGFEVFKIPSNLVNDKYEKTKKEYDPKILKEIVSVSNKDDEYISRKIKERELISILRKSFVSN